MADYLLSEHLNFTLTWVGFGTVLGLLALIVLPSKDGRGALATVLMSTAGTMIGCILIQKMSSVNEWVQPITPHGFVVGAAGAIVMLIFFRVLGGEWLTNGGRRLSIGQFKK